MIPVAQFCAELRVLWDKSLTNVKEQYRLQDELQNLGWEFVEDRFDQCYT